MQVLDDLLSGLTGQFEAIGGGCRLVIAGRALPSGSREILFDAEGCITGIGAAGVKKLHL